ncbi:hypothetical protein ACFXDP_27405 [Streptomyces sp. NPDC059374]|uniref:hypothetical protein n=1 Tax=Streptomyces sp. NPDC059374 TaxID=3346814 RepID=UPI003689F83A
MRSPKTRRIALVAAAALTSATMVASAAPTAVAADVPDDTVSVTTPQGEEVAGSGLMLSSDEQFVQQFGAEKARAHGISEDDAEQTEKNAAANDAILGDARASHWSVRKFVGTDADGRHIPTRQGNREFGWVHFSGPHNIKSSKVIKTALSEHPEKKQGHRLEYGAVLHNGLGLILARVRVIVQYHWETKDHKYKLADHSEKIGVITAFCQGTNRCPNALNEV